MRLFAVLYTARCATCMSHLAERLLAQVVCRFLAQATRRLRLAEQWLFDLVITARHRARTFGKETTDTSRDDRGVRPCVRYLSDVCHEVAPVTHIGVEFARASVWKFPARAKPGHGIHLMCADSLRVAVP